ncbi:MAG: TylF/MycF family methyltransferase [Nannocystaceae bacterium]|nr:TylF/MycF family methyltransferase [Nannocystaceae bacterium]
MSAYLELLKRAVTNYINLGDDKAFGVFDPMGAKSRYDQYRWNIPRCAQPQSLLSSTQLGLIERLMQFVLDRELPGDFLEAGVWRGGAAIFMRGVLAERKTIDRRVWLADTFAGIPYNTDPAQAADPVDQWEDRWEASLDEVRDAFARYGLLDDQVRFVQGPIVQSLAGVDLPPLAIARIDVDSYDSYRDALCQLVPRVVDGGYVIIDDWHLPGCKRAVQNTVTSMASRRR